MLRMTYKFALCFFNFFVVLFKYHGEFFPFALFLFLFQNGKSGSGGNERSRMEGRDKGKG